MGRYAVLAALAVLGASPGAGDFAEGVVTILPTNAQVKAYSAASVGITVRVKHDFHVQANPVENPSLIPITFKIDPAAGVTVGKPPYPVANASGCRVKTTTWWSTTAPSQLPSP
ncbi:MAG TPA: hypothetical protein VF493_22145 [Terriglobales bacterium]